MFAALLIFFEQPAAPTIYVDVTGVPEGYAVVLRVNGA